MNALAPRRIRIALAPEAPSETIYEPAFKIALRSRIPVECICIEDTRLLDIVGLPLSRVIHAYSHETSPLDETMVRRAMRVTADRARARFAATVTQRSIEWSFRTRQIARLPDAFADAAPGDLIVVPLLRGGRNVAQVRGLVDAVSEHIAASLLVLNEGGMPEKSVLAVFDGDRDDLAAAATLAQDFGCPLTVFAVGGDAATAQHHADEVSSYLGQSAQPAIVSTIVPHGADTLDAAIRDAAPGTVVVDRTGAALRGIDVVALLVDSSASLLLRN